MRRRNGDEVTRDLERRVLGGDLSAVVPLARLYERLSRGEDLREIVVNYQDGGEERRTTVTVAAGHPLAKTRRWTAEPDPHARERDVVDALLAAGIASHLEFPGYAHVVFPDGLTLSIGYVDGPIGADLTDTEGYHIAGWEKGDSAESDTAWAVRVARDATNRIAAGELVPGPGLAPEVPRLPRERTPAQDPVTPLVGRALDELGSIGITADVWRMGGNVQAAGVDPSLMPEGIHAFVAPDPSGATEAVVVVGWEAPATFEQARALLRQASFGDAIEDAGDDTIAVSGALWRVLGTLARVVFAANQFVCECQHPPHAHATLVGACGLCGCERVHGATRQGPR